MPERTFTGSDLIKAGFEPGPHFGDMLKAANEVGRIDKAALSKLLPPAQLGLTGGLPFALLAEAQNDDERANLASVSETMTELLKTPILRAGAAMPDACPAGPMGTIPVGGVAASEAIHPGMHSAVILLISNATDDKGKEP